MMMLRFFTILISVCVATAYSPPVDRRRVFQSIAAAAVGVSPASVQALDQCRPNANNCVFTTWTPPSGTSKTAAVNELRSVIEAYPQEGQSDVDGGGWTIASDDLDSSGTARVEYRSSGKGFFAKTFNGGKPFVDDLNLEVDGTGTVKVRSQSRVGDSDLGVNLKRVNYLAAELKGKGWST